MSIQKEKNVICISADDIKFLFPIKPFLYVALFYAAKFFVQRESGLEKTVIKVQNSKKLCQVMAFVEWKFLSPFLYIILTSISVVPNRDATAHKGVPNSISYRECHLFRLTKQVAHF